jgi:hypothetical protein
MRHAVRVVAVSVLVFLLGACSGTQSMMGDKAGLAEGLAKKLGVTDTQANGGVGAMLQLAQEKLAAGEFDSVAKAIPGSQKYLDTAKQLLGGAKVGDGQQGLKGAFAKMGMSPEMVDKFKPPVLDYVGKVGGEQAKSLLATALK